MIFIYVFLQKSKKRVILHREKSKKGVKKWFRKSKKRVN